MSSFLLTQATGTCFGGFVVIDPGHSPQIGGATSCSGRPEYAYNVALTKTIVSYLSSQKIPAVVTHKEDEDISLSKRAQLATGCRLLISIHHDSVQPQFISPLGLYPCSNKASGYSIFVSSKNKNYSQSLHYAKKLGMLLRTKGFKPSQHHGEKIVGESKTLIDSENGVYLFDDLVVLKNTRAPAILLEAAVIVHPQDEKIAQSSLYKLNISAAIAEMLFGSPW